MTVLEKNQDKLLVVQLQKNDVEAFDALFHKYSDKLFRFSFSLLKSTEESKEIVQEAFLRIWEKRSDIDSQKSFKSFLFSISYNLIVDQLRLRLKDQEYRKFLVHYFESESFDLKSNLDYDKIVAQVKDAVEELPAKRKQIYVLSRELGLSNNEIAERLDISVKTVENQITLALKHLRKRLGSSLLEVALFIILFA
ncbi:RNA polymerase sigma-70 factor [Puteibacter caeruleilacunae]|nr:RNA polymerase sigma-70 factor [Puteibacter caeruleilacunae]